MGRVRSVVPSARALLLVCVRVPSAGTYENENGHTHENERSRAHPYKRYEWGDIGEKGGQNFAGFVIK